MIPEPTEALPVAMTEAGERAWHQWEEGAHGNTLGECVRHVYLAMEAAREPEAAEAMIEDALFAVNPRVSKATADYARAACRNLAAALTREPEAGKLREALDIAKAVIGEANNSLYGSQSYFITTAKGEVAGALGVTDPPDKNHLAHRIEALKSDSRAAWRAMRQLESGLSNDALDTLRTALSRNQGR
jgi:hypothetical protein